MYYTVGSELYSAITVRTPHSPKTPLEMTPREFSESIILAAEKINRSLLAINNGTNAEKIISDDVKKEVVRDLLECKKENKNNDEEKDKNRIIEEVRFKEINELNLKVKRKDEISQNDNNEYFSSSFLSAVTENRSQKKENKSNENKNYLHLNSANSSSKNNKINNTKNLKNIDDQVNENSTSTSTSTKVNNNRKKETTNYYEIELEIEEEQFQLEQLSVNSKVFSPPCGQISNLVNNKPILNFFTESLSPNPCLNPALNTADDNKKKNKNNKNNDNNDNNNDNNDSNKNDNAKMSVLSVDVQASKRRTSSFDEYPNSTKQTKNNKNNNNDNNNNNNENNNNNNNNNNDNNNSNNNNNNLTDGRHLRRSTSPPRNRGQTGGQNTAPITGQISGQVIGKLTAENKQNGFDNGNTGERIEGENTDLNQISVMTSLNVKSTYLICVVIFIFLINSFEIIKKF